MYENHPAPMELEAGAEPRSPGMWCLFSHSPVPCDTGRKNFSFVECCNSTLLETLEGEGRGAGDPRYLLGDQFPPSFPKVFYQSLARCFPVCQ